MKAKLMKNNDIYNLWIKAGKKIEYTEDEVVSFFKNYKNLEYSIIEGCAFSDKDMESLSGITIAEITDDGYLLIKNYDEFINVVFRRNITLLSTAEFAAKHEKSRAAAAKHCRNNKFVEQFKTSAGWMIAADEEWPV